jgi:hypothetical protein
MMNKVQKHIDSQGCQISNSTELLADLSGIFLCYPKDAGIVSYVEIGHAHYFKFLPYCDLILRLKYSQLNHLRHDRICL